MFKIVLLLFVFYGTVISFKIKQNSAPEYCYATDKSPYKFFATKTGYESVSGNDDYNDAPNECKPVQFWSMNRHGTRLPDKKSIKKMKHLAKLQNEIIQNYENEIPNSRKNSLCEQDIELLKSWTWNNSITKDNAEFLAEQGWNELRNIAKRNYKKFSELFSTDYSEKDYLFRHTMKQRTQASFRAYAQGLFGSYNQIHPITVENDTLIQTYKYCKLYKETVDNPELYVEYYKLRESTLFQKLISDVSERFGLNYLLDIDTIDNIFNMCRFQQAWYPDKKSPWCVAFTEDQLKIIEYAEDLDYYYFTGYGLNMTEKVGCMPLQDMMRRFENVINGVQTEPKSIHYFSHSSALQTLMVSMGMFKDKIPLKADNWDKLLNRNWRTSFFGSFATNVNAVLYKCSEGDKYRVEFYVIGNKYYYPECPNGLCSWKIVKNKFSQIAENCNMDFCNNDGI